MSELTEFINKYSNCHLFWSEIDIEAKDPNEFLTLQYNFLKNRKVDSRISQDIISSFYDDDFKSPELDRRYNMVNIIQTDDDIINEYEKGPNSNVALTSYLKFIKRYDKSEFKYLDTVVGISGGSFLNKLSIQEIISQIPQEYFDKYDKLYINPVGTHHLFYGSTVYMWYYCSYIKSD